MTTRTPVPFFRVLHAAVVATLIAGCGAAEQAAPPSHEPAYRYATAAELTSDYVQAKDRSFSVLRPEGWELTRDDRNAPNILLWLVRKDYAASISFTPMNMDPALYATVRRDGLPALARVSLSLNKGRAQDSVRVVQPVETFTLNKRSFAAYEYRVGSTPGRIRVVVFDTGAGVMECTMMPATEAMDDMQNLLLIETQQSVLASLLMP